MTTQYAHTRHRGFHLTAHDGGVVAAAAIAVTQPLWADMSWLTETAQALILAASVLYAVARAVTEIRKMTQRWHRKDDEE